MSIFQIDNVRKMREIKFRGKDMKSNNWVYGYLVVGDGDYKDTCYICPFGVHGLKYKVHPSSVGQYTELKDKNNKEIYDGDIVNVYDPHFAKENVVISWHEEGLLCWMIGETGLISTESKYYEIVGNIHENSGLIKNEA